MMKKLFVLGLVLAISSMAMAGTVTLTITGGATPSGTFEGKPSYNPSDTITITLVASGMGTQYYYWISQFTGDVTTDNGGIASNLGFHANFSLTAGVLNPGGGILIDTVQGAVGTNPGVADGSVMWFDFHVPDLDWSDIITIGMSPLTFLDYGLYPLALTWGGDLEIHVVPEPITILLLGLGGFFLRRRK